MALTLVKPSLDLLPSYIDALMRGWCYDTTRAAARNEELVAIEKDAAAYIDTLDDPLALAGPVTLPDGSQVPRLPGFRRWMWDGEFCGIVGLRWRNGTETLPATCLGHVGYGVVPWKRNQGYATRALALMLPEAKKLALAYVEIVTDVENTISQKIVLANGGRFVERFTKLAANGGGEGFRYRIFL